MPTTPHNLLSFSARSEWLRMRTFVMLRWMAITGQTIAILVAVFGLGLQLNIPLCLLAIGASITLNIISTTIMPANKRLSERGALMALAFDMGQLVILLYLTGGINNPFTLLILGPVTISATALTLRATMVLGILSMLSIILLTLFHRPLITANGAITELPSLFQWGNGAALVIGVIFLAAYARRVTNETFSMSQALAATQMALDREHKLSILGGVVAAAAHEMGTPLATIKLVSSELQEELAQNPELKADAELIHSQAIRLSAILKDMGQTGKDDLHLKSAPLSTIIHEAAQPHESRGKEIIYLFNGNDEIANSDHIPQIMRQPEIIHGLRNLVQNAVDFAQTRVWVNALWDDANISILIGDDGKGYSSEMISRIGDPFLGGTRKKAITAETRPEYEGMGLGLFIAKTLLERAGAQLTFSNAYTLGTGTKASDNLQNMKGATGAIVRVQWSRRKIEKPRNDLGENQPFQI